MPAHCVLWWVRLGALWSLFLKFFICVFIWLQWVLVVARGIKSPDQGSNSGPLHCEHQNVNHSTTREVPGASFIRHESHAFSTSQRSHSLIPSPLGIEIQPMNLSRGHIQTIPHARERPWRWPRRVPHIQVSGGNQTIPRAFRKGS